MSDYYLLFSNSFHINAIPHDSLCVLSALRGSISNVTAELAETAKVQYQLSHWLYFSILSAFLDVLR